MVDMWFPIDLGDKTSTSTIHSAHDDLGNSMPDKYVKDTKDQVFDTFSFKVHVERLDSILSDSIDVKLMKMDA